MTEPVWHAVRKKHLPALYDFLASREPWCVPFLEALENRKAVPGNRFFVSSDASGIRGALYWSAGGAVLPVFDTPTDGPPRTSLGRPPYSVMGKTDWVQAYCSTASLSGGYTVEYFLMTRRVNGLSNLPPNHGSIRSMGPAELGVLYPLQKGYEIEEVMLDPRMFSEKLCRANLLRILRNQHVFAVHLDGSPVCKANTNALGLHWEQIGGVYTLPEYRNRGLGRAVIAELVRDIASRGKKACLFVNTTNTPAIHLYRACGFVIEGDYRITYPHYGV